MIFGVGSGKHEYHKGEKQNGRKMQEGEKNR